VERGLHEPPLPLVVLALRHHEPVADQPLGPPEAKPLLQLPGLPDQRVPDGGGAVQYINVKRSKADSDYLPVPAHPLEERERIPSEFHRVPKQPVPARHQWDGTRGLPA
jgi:hypothetical protein